MLSSYFLFTGLAYVGYLAKAPIITGTVSCHQGQQKQGEQLLFSFRAPVDHTGAI